MKNTCIAKALLKAVPLLVVAAAAFPTTASAITPGATTNAATNLAITSATVNGIVNPGGEATTYYFDYGTSFSFELGPTATQSAGAGVNGVNVSADLGSLLPSTTYLYQLVAVNGSATVAGNVESFTTDVAAVPAIDINDVSTTATTADLSFYVFNAASYSLVYGVTDAYGTDAGPQSAGPGGFPGINEGTTQLTGLRPATTYYFSATAAGDDGTNAYTDSFATTNPLTNFSLKPRCVSRKDLRKHKVKKVSANFTVAGADNVNLSVVRVSKKPVKKCVKKFKNNYSAKKSSLEKSVNARAGKNKVVLASALTLSLLKPAVYRVYATDDGGGDNGKGTLLIIRP